MAAGILSKPGSKHGPCVGNCYHIDCECNRELSRKLCNICNKKIGYNTRFYQIESNIYAHAACAEGRI